MFLRRPAMLRESAAPKNWSIAHPSREAATSDMPRHLAATAAAVLALTTLGACLLPGISEPGLGDGVVVKNETELTLTFKLFDRGTAFDLPTEVGPREEAGVLPGNLLRSPTGPGEDGCTVGDLVALGPDGAEVARHPPPLCTGDVWVIEDAEAVSSP
jgi:hypothetical protein